MRIEKAIEHLEYVKQRAQREGNMGTYDGAQLGIEALKRLRDLPKVSEFGLNRPLPGETKE